LPSSFMHKMPEPTSAYFRKYHIRCLFATSFCSGAASPRLTVFSRDAPRQVAHRLSSLFGAAHGPLLTQALRARSLKASDFNAPRALLVRNFGNHQARALSRILFPRERKGPLALTRAQMAAWSPCDRCELPSSVTPTPELSTVNFLTY